MALSSDFVSIGLLITVIAGVIIAEIIKSIVIHYAKKGSKRVSRKEEEFNFFGSLILLIFIGVIFILFSSDVSSYLQPVVKTEHVVFFGLGFLLFVGIVVLYSYKRKKKK